MVDKWAVRLNKERLYNEVRSPEEGDHEKKKKEHQGRVTVASGRTEPKEKHFI